MNQEQEQFIAYTLNDFRQVVATHGIDTVVKQMDEVTFWNLYRWFQDNYSLTK